VTYGEPAPLFQAPGPLFVLIPVAVLGAIWVAILWPRKRK
jgi:hypothetical protein